MGLVLHLNPDDPDRNAIAQAAVVLKRSGVAVFPTETVYGLGADLRSAAGIERVFRIKRRPPDLPLMIHCANQMQARFYLAEWSERAEMLARVYWPGPLALVLRRSDVVPGIVAGGKSVGIRVVADRVAQELIDELGAPIAGTSANRHGHPATSRFDRIEREVIDEVDVALDSGRCGEEVASTVLDLTVDPPRVVRAGVVPVAGIEEVLRLKVVGP
ncbi:MAG: L-threonylcarbamoyladenylate synthase [candidate division WOR-3 bacterium]